jgi:uncharacterized paraquat-inducible protein A
MLLRWTMTRTQLSEAQQAASSMQCSDCRTIAPADAPYCLACGGPLRSREKSKVAYGAVAVLFGLGAVILYFIARN